MLYRRCRRETGLSKLEKHSGRVTPPHARHLCSSFLQVDNFFPDNFPCGDLLWGIATTNTTEDGLEINFVEKEVIIMIADAIAKRDLRVEMSGLIDAANHLGKIDAEEIIENLIEGDEIALGDTTK